MNRWVRISVTCTFMSSNQQLEPILKGFFKFLMDSWAHASPSLQMTPYIIKIDLWEFGSVGALQRQNNQSYWQHDSKDAELASLSFYYI
jgi:hypothetical protein